MLKRTWVGVRCLTMAAVAWALLMGATARADDPAEKRLFWKVTSPTTEVYLLGSIHIAKPDLYPLPPEIEKAFAESKVLVVEVDITKIDQTALALQVLKDGTYPVGDSLDKHLTPEAMKAFNDFCQKNGLMAGMFVRMKPGLAVLTATVAVIQNLGYTTDMGVDKHFLDAVEKETRTKAPGAPAPHRVVELESVEDQLKLMLGMDDLVAESSLKQEVEETTGEKFEEMMQAWKAGDVKKMTELLLASDKTEAGKKLMQKMIYDRNPAMATKVEEFLGGKEKVFIVVGAAHLVGAQGVLRQLEADHFTVVQPTVTGRAETLPATKP